jgi:hypothetical protein
MQPIRTLVSLRALKSTKGDAIAVKSTFTTNNDARARIPGTIPLLRSLFQQLRSGPVDDRTRPWSREETPPRPSLASANCPGRGALNATNSPVNPTRDHSDCCSNHSKHGFIPMCRPDLVLGRSLCLDRARSRPTAST